MQRYSPIYKDYPSPLFKLTEAVINPGNYLQIVKSLFYDNKDYLLSSTNNQELINKLNKIFYSFRIIFEFENSITEEIPEAEFGVNSGGTEDDVHSTIYIFTNPNLLNSLTTNFDATIKNILQVFGHELIHREQAIRVNNHKLIKVLFREKNLDEYFNDKLEVMAFAWHLVEINRNLGNDKEKMLNALKEGNLVLNPLYALFVKYFPKNHPQIKRLNKYIYQYLTGQDTNISTPLSTTHD